MKEIKDILQKYDSLLPLGTSLSYSEYENRAASFLEAMTFIINIKHLFSEDKIKLLSIQTVTYAQELLKGTAKTMTENKVTAEASENYTIAREALESMDNDISYLRAKYEVYQNAHVFYRNLAKGDNS